MSQGNRKINKHTAAIFITVGMLLLLINLPGQLGIAAWLVSALPVSAFLYDNTKCNCHGK